MFYLFITYYCFYLLLFFFLILNLRCVASIQFRKLDTDPTKSLERKVQRTLRKIKHKFEENEYKKLYPTGSRPGLFYGKPKVHKLEQQHNEKDWKNLR